MGNLFTETRPRPGLTPRATTILLTITMIGGISSNCLPRYIVVCKWVVYKSPCCFGSLSHFSSNLWTVNTGQTSKPLTMSKPAYKVGEWHSPIYTCCHSTFWLTVNERCCIVMIEGLTRRFDTCFVFTQCIVLSAF